MLSNQSEDDYDPFKWVSKFCFISPGPLAHGISSFTIDHIKCALIDSLKPSFESDFDIEQILEPEHLSDELSRLVNSIDLSQIKLDQQTDKFQSNQSHKRMTVKLKESLKDFSSLNVARSSIKRVIRRRDQALSEFKPQIEDEVIGSLELSSKILQKEPLCDKDLISLENSEAILWEASTKIDQFDSECILQILHSLETIVPQLSDHTWTPINLDLSLLIRKIIDNINNIYSNNECIDDDHLLICLEICLEKKDYYDDSIKLLILNCLLYNHFKFKEVATIKKLVNNNSFSERELLSEFLGKISEMILLCEKISEKRYISKKICHILVIFSESHLYNSPLGIDEFIFSFVEVFVGILSKKSNLEVVIEIIEHLAATAKCYNYFYLSYFFIQFFTRSITILLSKSEIHLKISILDILLDLISTYSSSMNNFPALTAAIESTKTFMSKFYFSESYNHFITSIADMYQSCGSSNPCDQHETIFTVGVLGRNFQRISKLLIKLISEESSSVKLKSLKALFLLSKYGLLCPQVNSSIIPLLLKCLQDSSLLIKEFAIESIIEKIQMGEEPDGSMIPFFVESVLLLLEEKSSNFRRKLMGLFPFIIEQESFKLGFITKLIICSASEDSYYSNLCFEFLKHNWIKPLFLNGNLMEEIVSVFSNIDDSELLLKFMKNLNEDGELGSKFYKLTEKIVDGLIESLLSETDATLDNISRNILQSLIVFCYGRYEILGPHISVLVFYAFDSKLPLSSIVSCKLLGLVAFSGSISGLKQQPKIIEKITKSIVQSTETIIPFSLKCLSAFDSYNSSEVTKLALKFMVFLEKNSDSKGKSAICRALLVLGYSAEYMIEKDCESCLEVIKRFYKDSGNFHTSYFISFCKLISKSFYLLLENNDYLSKFKKSLEDPLEVVRTVSQEALLKILESGDDINRWEGVEFDPKGFNSLSEKTKNRYNLIEILKENIISCIEFESEKVQYNQVKILRALLRGSYMNPLMIIPSALGLSLGSQYEKVSSASFEFSVECIEKYSSLLPNCYQRALICGFKINRRAGSLNEEMLDYIMHEKGKWKDILDCVIQLNEKIKDLEFSRWLLNGLLRCGVATISEKEYLLRKLEAQILPLSEVYFEELEEQSDPLIYTKLYYLLNVVLIIRELCVSLENKKRISVKPAGNGRGFLQVEVAKRVQLAYIEDYFKRDEILDEKIGENPENGKKKKQKISRRLKGNESSDEDWNE